MRRGRHSEERIAAPGSDAELHAGDVLLVISTAADHERLLAEQDLTQHPITERGTQRWLWEMGAATVLIHPESGLIGKSLREAEFRSQHHLPSSRWVFRFCFLTYLATLIIAPLIFPFYPS